MDLNKQESWINYMAVTSSAKNRLGKVSQSRFSQAEPKYDNKRICISTYEQNIKYIKWKLSLEVSEVSEYNVKKLLQLALNVRF